MEIEERFQIKRVTLLAQDQDAFKWLPALKAAGMEITLSDVDAERGEQTAQALRDRFDVLVKVLTYVPGGTDLVLDLIPESLDQKKARWSAFDYLCPPDVMVACTAFAIDPQQLEDHALRGSAVCGVYGLKWAPVIVIFQTNQLPDLYVQVLRHWVRALGRRPIVVRERLWLRILRRASRS